MGILTNDMMRVVNEQQLGFTANLKEEKAVLSSGGLAGPLAILLG
jgi:hypothetical protein